MSNESALSDSSLVPIYGPAKAQAVKQYLDAFNKSHFVDGFLPLQYRIVQGRAEQSSLLVVECPLALSFLDIDSSTSNTSPISLGLLFTLFFPERPPVCVVKAAAGSSWTIVDQHPAVGERGALKLASLPSLQKTLASQPVPSLLEILLAVTEYFSEVPVASQVPHKPPPQQQSYVQQQEAQQPGQVTTFAPPAVSAPPSAAHAEAANVLLRLLSQQAGSYLTARVSALESKRKNDETNTQLVHLKQSLQQRKAALEEGIDKLEQITATLEAANANGMPPINEALVPVSSLHAQALDLLAEVHACDDLMELHEKRLKKGSISADAFLRAISETARKQFLNKYLLRKIYNRLNAESSVQTLHQTYSVDVDAAIVQSVFAESDYDFAAASAILKEMAGK